MEEIKVEDYIRTIDGYIRKVEQVNRKGSYDGLCHGAYNVDIPYKYSQGISAKKIKSHSSNLIDLIEVGDLVKIEDNDGITHWFEVYTNSGIYQYTILEIVTKEMMKSISYKI